MKILGILMFLVAITTALGIFKPALMNKGAKYPLPRIVWVISTIVFLGIGFLFLSTGEEAESSEVVSNQPAAEIKNKEENQNIIASYAKSSKSNNDDVLIIYVEAKKQYEDLEQFWRELHGGSVNAWVDLTKEWKEKQDSLEKKLDSISVSNGKVELVEIITYTSSLWREYRDANRLRTLNEKDVKYFKEQVEKNLREFQKE